jgi:hypothetical protein
MMLYTGNCELQIWITIELYQYSINCNLLQTVCVCGGGGEGEGGDTFWFIVLFCHNARQPSKRRGIPWTDCRLGVVDMVLWLFVTFQNLNRGPQGWNTKLDWSATLSQSKYLFLWGYTIHLVVSKLDNNIAQLSNLKYLGGQTLLLFGNAY